MIRINTCTADIDLWFDDNDNSDDESFDCVNIVD